MVPDVLHIGPIPIHIFGIMLALGFLAAGWATGVELARKGYARELASSALVWAAVGGLVGARLWMIVEGWSDFVRDPVHVLFGPGGFVFYGGLAGGALAMTLFFRRHRIPWLVGADCAAPGIVLGQAIGRWGCQLAGDGDWGASPRCPGGWRTRMRWWAGTSRPACGCIPRPSTSRSRTSPSSRCSGACAGGPRPTGRSSAGTSC